MRHLSKWFMALVSAFVCSVGWGAGEVISVNMAANQASLANVDGNVGVEAVAAKKWMNIDASISAIDETNNNTPSAITGVAFTDQNDSYYPKMALHASSRGEKDKGTWYGDATIDDSSSATTRMLYGFLDDSNGAGNEACIQVTDIPFSEYTVYVYFNRDNAEDYTNAFPPYEINGKLYKGDGTTTKEIEASADVGVWGTVKYSVLTEGVNTLKVEGLTDTTLRIFALRYCTLSDEELNDSITKTTVYGRGCISGFQIVNTGTVKFDGASRTLTTATESWNEASEWSSETTPIDGDAKLIADTVDTTVTMDKNGVALDGLTLEGSKKITFAAGTEADGTTAGSLSATTTLVNTDVEAMATGVTLGTATISVNKTLTVDGTDTDVLTGVNFVNSTATLKLAGTTEMTALPVEGLLGKSGTIEFAQALNLGTTGDFRLAGDAQTITIRKNITANRMVTGDLGGANTVINQEDGIVNLESELIDCDSTDASAILFGHYSDYASPSPAHSASSEYNLKAGTLKSDGAICLGWDATAGVSLNVGQAKGNPALVSVYAIRYGYNNGNRNNAASVTLYPTGTIEVGAGGINLLDKKTFTLAGGTLKVKKDATVNVPHADGLNVTADSTLLAATDTTMTVSCVVKGSKVLTIGSATDTGTVDLSGANLSNYTGTLIVAGGEQDVAGATFGATMPTFGFAGAVPADTALTLTTTQLGTQAIAIPENATLNLILTGLEVLNGYSLPNGSTKDAEGKVAYYYENASGDLTPCDDATIDSETGAYKPVAKINTWTGSGDASNWSDPTNWTDMNNDGTGDAPTAEDDVVIELSQSLTIKLPADAKANSLIVRPTATATEDSITLTFEDAEDVEGALTVALLSEFNVDVNVAAISATLATTTIASGKTLTIVANALPFATLAGKGALVIQEPTEATTLAINGHNTYSGGTKIPANVSVVMGNNAALGTGIVTGAGMVSFDATGVAVADVETALYPTADFTTTAWTGTFALSNVSMGGWKDGEGCYVDLSKFGNAESTLTLQTVQMRYPAGDGERIVNLRELEILAGGWNLCGTGTTNATVLTVNADLTGTGTIHSQDTVGKAPRLYFMKDSSQFTGAVTIQVAPNDNSRYNHIIFGEEGDDTETNDKGQVIIGAAKVVNIVSSTAWGSTLSQMIVKGTIGGTGTISSATIFNSGATLLATTDTSALTVNGALTLPTAENDVLKVKFETAPTAATQVLTKSDFTTMPTSYEIWVGTENKSSAFALKAEDGLKVYPAAATIDGVAYASISDAIAVAGSGKTVTLVADATSVDIAKDVTLNLNGHKVSTINVTEGTLSLLCEVGECIINVSGGTLHTTDATKFSGTTINMSGTGAITSLGYPTIKKDKTLTIDVAENLTVTHGTTGDFYQGFEGEGSLKKTGAGKFITRLMISGTTTIDAGTLGIRGNNRESGTDYQAFVTLSGAISGSGALEVVSGTVILTAANTYSGGTKVTAGTLKIAGVTEDTAVLPEGKVVNVELGATLELNQGLSFAGVEGKGTTKVTGSYHFGLGGEEITKNLNLKTKLIVEEEKTLYLRSWQDSLLPLDVELYGTIVKDSTTETGDNGALLWTCNTAKVTIAKDKTLKGDGTITGDLVLADGAILDTSKATADACLTISGAVTLPATGTVALTLPANVAAGTELLKASNLDATKFTATLPANMLLTASETALSIVEKPTFTPAEGEPAMEDTTAQALVDFAAAAGVPADVEVSIAEGSDHPAGIELFKDVATADTSTGAVTITYDFGVEKMTVKNITETVEGEAVTTAYLVVKAKVSTDYATGTTVKLYRKVITDNSDGTTTETETDVGADVVTDLSTIGESDEDGAMWLKVKLDDVAGTTGTHGFKVKAEKEVQQAQ